MLERDEVSLILSQLSRLRPNDGFAPQGPDLFARYHCSFLDSNIDYKRRTHELLARVFGPHVEHHLNGYRILNCNFYVKPAGTGEFAIHQNWPAIADLDDTTVTVWCPLVDVVARNGALQLVEGSHKLLPHVEGPNSPGYFTRFRRELIENYLKPHPMNAGEALIFDDSLIHWSANNDSEHARVAIQILCVPAGVQPVYFFLDPRHREKFELIEVDSEFFVSSLMNDLRKRQPGWRSAGFVANENRPITEKEFAGLLARGEHIRANVYSRGPHKGVRFV